MSGTDAEHTVQWDFFCTAGRKSGEWKKIEVPSCWEQQGFGNYNYGRDYKTNGKNARFYDEKGIYRYSFKVPEKWRGKNVSIVFDASMTDTEVRINGKPAGAIHQGAFYRFKYDITDLLYFDKPNTMQVTVNKMSNDASVNSAERLADYWVMGGIFRPVFLEATPRQCIDYVTIDAKADGRFSMLAYTKGLMKNAILVTTITDARKQIVSVVRTPVNISGRYSAVAAPLKDIRAWTSETPDLYNAHVVLKDGAGKIIFALNPEYKVNACQNRYFHNDLQYLQLSFLH